jgi:hypothetical protein
MASLGRSNERHITRQAGRGYDTSGGHQYGGAQYGGAQYGGNGPYHGGAQGGSYGGGYPPPINYQPRDWRANWHDEHHPKLKTMMVSYLERTNG